MINISKQQYKKLKNIDVKSFYKNNLQGKFISNPTLGQINFTQLGLGETIHRTKRNLRPFICLLKDIVETGTCDGKLEKLYKPRKDRITGFYHIKNTIKLSFIKVAIDVLIAQDQDGNKYYMFKKDPQGYLGEDKSSQRGPSGSINIITYFNENVKPDPENPKIGDVFWLGDCIRIEVVNILKPEETKIQKLNKKLDEYLGD